VCVCVSVCVCSTHSMVTIFHSRSSDGHITHIPSRVFETQELMCGVGCVWLCPCPCPRLRDAFCFLSSTCMERCPKCPFGHFPLVLGQLCVICPVCVYRPQFTARTARCSFLPTQPHMSTHVFDPQE